MKTRTNATIWLYLAMILTGLGLFLWWKLSFLSPILLTMVFFWFLIVPGFGLARLLNWHYQDCLDQLMTWLVLGLIYGLGLSLLGIIIGLNIATLAIIYLVLITLILIVAFILDWRRAQTLRPAKINFKIKDIFQVKHLINYLALLVVVAMLIVIGLKGALFRGGDPLYHLAILQKVMGGQPLTIENLSYVKEKFHIAYGFPIWHIFNGVLIKIFGANLFSFWRAMVLPLSALSMLIWFWVFQKLFNLKWLAIFGLIIFAIFTFNWDAGYLFTTINIPHTLSQLILLPLSIGLALKYIFDQKSDWRGLTILSILVILSAAIHLTSYFYYLAVVFILGIIFAIGFIGTADYQPILKKIGWVLLATVAPFILLVSIMELSGIHLITEAIKFYDTADQAQNYRYANFSEMALAVRLSYCALPLLLLFVRKQKPLLVILASFILLPLVYLDPIRPWVIKFLSIIWLKRLYANVLWYPVIWTLILGFAITIIDRVNDSISKIIRWVLTGTIVILALFVLWLQIKVNLAGQIYDQIFSSNVSQWINQNYWWVIMMLSLVAIIILFLAQKQPKINNFLVVEEPKNYLIQFGLVFVVALVLVSPHFNSLVGNFSKARYLIKPLPKTSMESLAISRVGQAATLKFIQTKIPAKTVWDTFGGFFYLPTVADVYMSNYNSTADSTYRALYDDKASVDQRLKILTKAKIEYILVSGNQSQLNRIEKLFAGLPVYFEQVYKSNKALIYKVNRANVARDYQKS